MSRLNPARTLLASAIAAVMTVATVQAQTTWYVDDDAPGDPGPGDPTVSDPLEDGSSDHPFDAIQEGIDAAADGDTVTDGAGGEIENVINQATLEVYQSYLRVLTGVNPIPFSYPPYYLTDRYSFGDDIHVAGQWIHDHFASLGLDASLHVFDSAYGPSVIGELPGTMYPDDIYIFCAHYDTVEGSPGCDDNGSGAAAVMMAARILSQYESEATIRFIAFSGEEQWMVGSLAYAEAAYAAGENIVAVINLDMILHPGFDDQEPDPDHDLDIGGDSASQWIGQHLAEQFALYTPLDVQLHESEDYAGNQWSFWEFGYDAVGVYENTPWEIWDGSMECYHAACDLMTNPHLEWDFGLEVVRGSMAGLVTLAGVLTCSGDYDCDGLPDEEDNCPFHPNPDQGDCDDDGYGDVCTIAECEGEAWCDDCNENGVPDECDIVDGTSADYDLNGVPDECDPDCNDNGIPDVCDLDCDTGNCASHPLGCGGSEDFDLNGVPDECDLDCNENGVPDACDLDCATGDCASHPLGCGGSDDYDLNGVPDECDPDCNENGVPDVCDLDCATGDCASHPLGCGGSEDCNLNAVPDECDIASGTSADADGNGIPDECEGACLADELVKLLASDGAAGDFLGIFVSVSGDIAVVGAPLDDDQGSESGSAYVFRFDGTSWVQEAKLLPSDGAASVYFGCSVAITGDTAVIGAYNDDDQGENSGSAYVFRYDGFDWVEEAKLLASDAAAGDGFGRTVAASDDAVVIGALYRDPVGAAYVFRFDGSTWIEEAQLLASDDARGDNFSQFVSISGDTIVIGAWSDDDPGEASGAAYVFRFDGSAWVEEVKLQASDGATRDYFGMGGSVFGDTIVIGACEDDDQGEDSGSAYVFRYDGANWVEEAKLLASDGAAGDWFGCSVAVSGDTAVIGVYKDDDSGDRSGSAYVFRYDGLNWVEEAKLLASDGASDDRFGYGTAVSGDTAVVGAYRDDDYGDQSGSAYVFCGLSDCNDNGVLDLCDVTDGTSADDNGNGIPDECEFPLGDMDEDGDVDVDDFILLADCLMGPVIATPEGCDRADLDDDGTIDLADFSIFQAAFTSSGG